MLVCLIAVSYPISKKVIQFFWKSIEIVSSYKKWGGEAKVGRWGEVRHF
jgi:hypothetical protein